MARALRSSIFSHCCAAFSAGAFALAYLNARWRKNFVQDILTTEELAVA